MKNLTAQETQTTSDGSSSDTQTEPKKTKAKKEEPVVEPAIKDDTIADFIEKIEVAKMSDEDDKWIETSQNVIDHYNPPRRGGLNGSKYFIYQGIKVCKFGDKEAILEYENMPMEQRLYGKGAAVNQIKNTDHVVREIK